MWGQAHMTKRAMTNQCALSNNHKKVNKPGLVETQEVRVKTIA